MTDVEDQFVTHIVDSVTYMRDVIIELTVTFILIMTWRRTANFVLCVFQ